VRGPAPGTGGRAPRSAGMDDLLEVDDGTVEAAAHRLIVQYGSRAAEVARGHARIAEDVDDERVWLDIAEVIDHDKRRAEALHAGKRLPSVM
jgi:hypothetical protein